MNENVKTAVISKNLGAYNLLDSKQNQWCLTVYAGGTSVSAMFDEDDEPDTDGEPPSAILELIRSRIDRLLFASKREEKFALIDDLLKSRDEIDSNWAKTQIKSLEKKIKSLQQFIVED